MKPFAMFAAAFTLAMFSGCQENAVEPIVADGAAKTSCSFSYHDDQRKNGVVGPRWSC